MAADLQPFEPSRYLTKIKGKNGASDYLEVKWRIVWFRDKYPEGDIATSVIELTADRAVFHATATAIKDGAIVGKASGTGSETPRDFGDYIEKAETKAVGRALAMLGFGTQFAPELDEGDRIVDSPVRATIAPQRTEPSQSSNSMSPPVPHAQQPITHRQKQLIFALANEIAEPNRWPSDWVKDDLYTYFAVDSTTKLTTAQGAHAIRALQQVRTTGQPFSDALAATKGA